jgi:hypothetical protein
MPTTSAAGPAAATPLTFPLNMIDGTGRVYTSFQLPSTPWNLGTPARRPVVKTTATSWTF